MIDVLRFWLIVQLFALAALPLAWRLLGALPSRGYVLAKPLGLLLVTYLLWLGGSLGLLRNSVGGILLCWLLVLGPVAVGGPGRVAQERVSLHSRGGEAAVRLAAHTLAAGGRNRGPFPGRPRFLGFRAQLQPGDHHGRRREVHGADLSQRHSAQRPLPAARPLAFRLRDQLLLFRLHHARRIDAVERPGPERRL